MTSSRAKARRFLSSSALRPGCYDAPQFKRLESRDPSVLEEYADLVMSQQRTEDYEARVRRVISILAGAIEADVRGLDRLGRCLDFCNAVVRMLEGCQIWAFVVRGSVRIEFPRAAELSTRYFWTRDTDLDFPGGFTGHAWLVVPPYLVVDFTAKHQRWQHGEGQQFTSDAVICDASTAKPHAPSLDLLVPNAHPMQVVDLFNPSLVDLWETIPPCQVDLGSVVVTYQPDGITAPPTPFKTMKEPKFGGVSPSRYFERLLPTLPIQAPPASTEPS